MQRLAWFLPLLLAACTTTGKLAEKSPAWRYGPPSPEALAEIEKRSKDYYRCIAEELSHYRYDGQGHAIDHMGALMAPCEKALFPIREVLERERIHPKVVERVLRQRRNRAARFLTFRLQWLEAQSLKH